MPSIASPPRDVQTRVRRMAKLRAARRALEDVTDPGELEETLGLARELLRRLQALSGDGGDHRRAEILNRREALQGVDTLLDRLSQRLREVLASADLPPLCASLAPLAREESGAIRALAAVALEREPESERMLDLLEFLVALLCCEGSPGARAVGRSPLEALPELADLGVSAVWEAHPDIDEAEQIFGRGVVRLSLDDLASTRSRIRSYKRRLGVRRLNPDVMAAAVAYDLAMANRLAELCGDHDSLDALAETVFGTDEEGAEAGLAPLLRRRSPLAATPQEADRSRLFWHALATVGLSIGLLALAVLLWQRPSVAVIEQDVASAISPHLAVGHLSGDDGTSHFLGTVGDSWDALSVAERRLVVARIAARLAGDGVTSVTLVNARRAIQARYEDDTLLWITAP